MVSSMLTPLYAVMQTLSFALSALYTQLFSAWDILNPFNTATRTFDPAVHLREHHLKDKVIVITGGHSGCGYETVRWMLHVGGCKRIYLLGRSVSAMQDAMSALWTEVKASGTERKDSDLSELVYIQCDLGDLLSVKAAAKEFYHVERVRLGSTADEPVKPRIDVLFANAGVYTEGLQQKTAQGFEMNWGVNCLGHHVLLQYLSPALQEAAVCAATESGSRRERQKNSDEPTFTRSSPRVIWTGSIAPDWMLCGPSTYFGSFQGDLPSLQEANGAAPGESNGESQGALANQADVTRPVTMSLTSYGRSKLGNYIAMRYSLARFSGAPAGPNDGETSPPRTSIFTCVVHPGVLRTKIQRHCWQKMTWKNRIDQWIFVHFLSDDQRRGCINLLWSAFIVAPGQRAHEDAKRPLPTSETNSGVVMPGAPGEGFDPLASPQEVSMEMLHGGFVTQWCKLGRVTKLGRQENLAQRHGERKGPRRLCTWPTVDLGKLDGSQWGPCSLYAPHPHRRSSFCILYLRTLF